MLGVPSMVPKITLYDKAFRRVDEIGDPEMLSCTPRHMQAGSATIVLPSDHPKAGLLTADDVRVVIEYPDETMLSGVVENIEGAGPEVSGSLTFSVRSDFREIHNILAWPFPAGGVGGQGDANAVYKRTGPAETVFKNIVRENALRMGKALTVAPDLGRGATITVEGRFVPASDVILGAVEDAGLGITVVQSGLGLLVDVYVPRVWSQTVTESSGAIANWSWSKSRAKATRATVVGQGDGDVRVVRVVVDTLLELTTGDKVEILVDAGKTTLASELEAAGRLALAENRAQAGISVTLLETEVFGYGGVDGYRVGDRIPFEIGPGIQVNDILREVTLTWSKDDGVRLSQTIGGGGPDSNDIHKVLKDMAKLLANVNKGIRRLAGR